MFNDKNISIMTALPNHTCFSVLNSFGVELPFSVAIVDVIKFDLPDADRYSRYGVMVNGNYCKLLTELANISGSWRKIGMAKSDAERHANLVNDKAERFNEVQSSLKSMTRMVGKTEVKLTIEQKLKRVREYNRIIDFFSNYHIDLAKKIDYDFQTKSIKLAV